MCRIVNPPHQVQRYFAEEHKAAQPITAHILTAGFWMLDQDSVVQSLRNEAATWPATPPNPTPDALCGRRYRIVDQRDNARNWAGHDTVAADLTLFRRVDDRIACRLLASNHNLLRPKDAVVGLAALDSPAGDLVIRFAAAGTCIERLGAALELARHGAGVDAFF